MLACVISGFRWYNALDDYERAMKLRDAYLKEKLQNRPTLPFTK
jgi:recombinational DNA repair ATPase RecF